MPDPASTQIAIATSKTEPCLGSAAGRRFTVMRRLAQNTGGRDYDTQAEDMHAVFRSIADELHALYEVGYYSSDPARDRTFRKVKISISRPDIKARAKPGYFATP